MAKKAAPPSAADRLADIRAKRAAEAQRLDTLRRESQTLERAVSARLKASLRGEGEYPESQHAADTARVEELGRAILMAEKTIAAIAEVEGDLATAVERGHVAERVSELQAIIQSVDPMRRQMEASLKDLVLAIKTLGQLHEQYKLAHAAYAYQLQRVDPALDPGVNLPDEVRWPSQMYNVLGPWRIGYKIIETGPHQNPFGNPS